MFVGNRRNSCSDPLIPGDPYYILQTNTSGQEGGGLMLGKIKESETCPLTVYQQFCDDDDDDYGLPVRFKVTNGGDVISEESNLEIEFVNKKLPKCAQSSKWLVLQDFLKLKTKWITIGALDEDEILHGDFKIKKQGLMMSMEGVLSRSIPTVKDIIPLKLNLLMPDVEDL
ncbi:hypothetical protein P8452_55616 [Trifolium repens]|nr:kunitz-type trypsin inhibitor 2 protein [Trifolium repens]WJX71642.1 hypothetical protein P8452_55616 [Trifolium repens]